MATTARTIEVDTEYIKGLSTRLDRVTDALLDARNFANQANRHRNWSLREKQRLEAAVNDLASNTNNVISTVADLKDVLRNAAMEFESGQRTTLAQMAGRRN